MRGSVLKMQRLYTTSSLGLAPNLVLTGRNARKLCLPLPSNSSVTSLTLHTSIYMHAYTDTDI